MRAKLGTVSIKWSQRIIFRLHVGAAGLLVVLMLMTVADVLRRAIIGKALVGVVELTGFIMVAIVFLAIAHTQVRKEHVTLDFLVTRLSNKTQAVLKIVMLLLGVVFIGLVGWQGAWDTLNSWQIQEWKHGPGGMHLLEWPARLVIPLGCFWLLVQLVIDIGHQIRLTAPGSKGK